MQTTPRGWPASAWVCDVCGVWGLPGGKAGDQSHVGAPPRRFPAGLAEALGLAPPSSAAWMPRSASQPTHLRPTSTNWRPRLLPRRQGQL